MRRKLAMSRALLHRSKLLLLDEPFSGLDPVAAVDLRERLRVLAAEERVHSPVKWECTAFGAFLLYNNACAAAVLDRRQAS